jgi:hypothetical protein
MGAVHVFAMDLTKKWPLQNKTPQKVLCKIVHVDVYENFAQHFPQGLLITSLQNSRCHVS